MNDNNLNLVSIIGAKLRQMVEKHGPCRHDIAVICLRVMGEGCASESKEWMIVEEDFWSLQTQAKKLSLNKRERAKRKKELEIATDWHDFLAFLHHAEVGEYSPIKEALKKHVVLQLMG